MKITAEHGRLAEMHEKGVPWQKWGPYLSERQWGTVREDYSEIGDAWNYFTHDQARSRAYRWGEDGIAGICDDKQHLCLAFALWNGVDPILKERMFGLTNAEGNHGEDVKEYYYYLDSTPTHSYMKYLYKYPQKAYPYDDLVAGNRRRNRNDLEYELLDTGVFDDDRYFDILFEFAKQSPEDMLIRITVCNRGPEPATLHVLPTLWFRNTWSWYTNKPKPSLRRLDTKGNVSGIIGSHPALGDCCLFCRTTVPLLFTENETNNVRIFGTANASPYVKDGINDYIVGHAERAVNPAPAGTKSAAHYLLTVGEGASEVIELRLTAHVPAESARQEQTLFGADYAATFATRRQEADAFYASIMPDVLGDDARNVMRQALAGMLWSKQYYYLDVEEWRKGDACYKVLAAHRQSPRNQAWFHLVCDDILSMPDKWEYPWFAAWDLAFHTLPLALIDIDFAKTQLELMTEPRYTHPNGQLPAYEWNFSDVNPPVHGLFAWRLYILEAEQRGKGDRQFLKRVFQKLLLNFTWWVNRKDSRGSNVFEGGFLGLDNIGVFDRSAPLPSGECLEQSDGTAWMAAYCLNMMEIALELAKQDHSYQELAYKFYEHFVYIAAAMDRMGENEDELWDEADGFFYDLLHLPSGHAVRLKLRSLVGLLPLCATIIITPEELHELQHLKGRIAWLANCKPELTHNLTNLDRVGPTGRHMLSVFNEAKLRRVLARMLDEREFFSPYGIRSLSRCHKEQPFSFSVDRNLYRVDYEPAESTTGMFGGNSNWRGPIWLPVNLMLYEALLKLHLYFGDAFKIECPTGSGRMMNLWEVAEELRRRLTRIFLREDGRRAVYGQSTKLQTDPHWRDLILFYEYFHGDNGAGIGASHQTGWTGVVARLIQREGIAHYQPKPLPAPEKKATTAKAKSRRPVKKAS
jgi:hypothetical protein